MSDVTTLTQTVIGTRVRPSVRPSQDTDRPVPWNVVLLDDQDHSYEYVIEMLGRVFGLSVERAFRIAQTVDREGRAVCLTTHKELAELKQEQVMSFGPDRLIAGSKGAMTAIIEPAEFGGDDSP